MAPGSDQPITVLMVAEKPSICTSIAHALNKGNMETRGRSPPVHEFQGLFLNKPALIRVTSVTGHVFSLDFPAKYQNWDSVDPLELFDAPTVHSPGIVI
jgi:DNA topoisomerase-3